jgi:hypothetical protein
MKPYQLDAYRLCMIYKLLGLNKANNVFKDIIKHNKLKLWEVNALNREFFKQLDK